MTIERVCEDGNGRVCKIETMWKVKW